MFNSIVVLSGGFDPLHEGHIAMFKAASIKYSKVIVGVNSDKWLRRKKGSSFQSIKTRIAILKSISYIDEVLEFDDSDNTAIKLINDVICLYKDHTIVFGNGGDRSSGNFPEKDFCNKHYVSIDDTLGGVHKINSSSKILNSWFSEEATRDWGIWRVLKSYDKRTKIKELIVKPGKRLSWQKHSNRHELWFVREGIITLHSSTSRNRVTTVTHNKGSYVNIPKNYWHCLENNTNKDLSVIEIQYGNDCIESDIERAELPEI